MKIEPWGLALRVWDLIEVVGLRVGSNLFVDLGGGCIQGFSAALNNHPELITTGTEALGDEAGVREHVTCDVDEGTVVHVRICSDVVHCVVQTTKVCDVEAHPVRILLGTLLDSGRQGTLHRRVGVITGRIATDEPRDGVRGIVHGITKPLDLNVLLFR